MFDAALIQQLQAASLVDARPAPASLTTTPAFFRPVTRDCFMAEARRQSLEPHKLLAVLKAEGGRIGTFRANTNGSYDIGPMQVNTVHLDEMGRVFKVHRSQLAQMLGYDGCFNVSVGAWLLRQKTNEAGGDFWYGIGRYHSKTQSKSTKYILKVHDIMQDIVYMGPTTQK